MKGKEREWEREIRSSCCGLVAEEPDIVSVRMWVRSPTSFNGLRIQCCCGCGIGHSCSSDLPPTLGTSIWRRCSPKKIKRKKKKKTRRRKDGPFRTQALEVGSWNSNPSSSLSTGISLGRLLMFLPQFPDHQNGYAKIKQNKKPQPNKKRVLWWLSGLRIQCCHFCGWGCCSGVGLIPGLGMSTYHTYALPQKKIYSFL